MKTARPDRYSVRYAGIINSRLCYRGVQHLPSLSPPREGDRDKHAVHSGEMKNYTMMYTANYAPRLLTPPSILRLIIRARETSRERLTPSHSTQDKSM